MNEMVFGSVSPMWTAMPLAATAYQPVGGIGAAPVFGSPVIAGGFGGGSSAAQASPASTPHSFAAPGFPAPAPFASNLFGVPIADATGTITAASLLAFVAVRRGQPQGPANDTEVEEFIYDALDVLPGAADVDIRCEGGRVTLTGSVQHKRIKRDVGEIAWAIPGLQDVQNSISITSRRRARAAGREAETPASVPARKQG